MSYPLGSVDTGAEAEFYAQAGEPGTRARFGPLAAGLVALVAITLFAGGLWFAYVLGTRHAVGGSSAEEVPLIRADERPTRVKPQNPGGMEIPDRDKLIYTQKRAAVEHLLPPPEKPLPRPTTAAAAQSEASPPQAAATAAGLPANAATPSAKPQQTGAKPTAKIPSPATEAPPAKTAAARLQLGSVRSEEAARQEWDRLKRSNGDLLGSLAAVPVRADLGDKGVFYRILTGSIADADKVCRELNHRNVSCVLVR